MRYILGILGLITLATTLTAVLLWLFGQITVAAIVATLTAALWLALIVVMTVAVTSWWTRETMQAGANLALQAQDINDRWDSKKMAGLAALVKEGARIGRSEAQTPPLGPGLPVLTLEDNWLPHLIEFEPADIIDGDSDRVSPSSSLG